MAWLLKFLIQPLGITQHGPSDRLSQQCAEILLEPSAARDRLTGGLYLGDDGGGIAQLERAFKLVTSTGARFTIGVLPKYPGPCSATLVHVGSPAFSMMSISPVSGQRPLPSRGDQVTEAVIRALRAEPGSLLVFLPGTAEIRRTETRLRERVDAEAVGTVPL